MNLVKPTCEFVSMTERPLETIQRFGSICWQTESKKTPEEFARMLITKKHTSQLRHATASFIWTCNRGVSHEIVRHTAGVVFSQESTRFCNYGKGLNIESSRLLAECEGQGVLITKVKRVFDLIESVYQCLVDAGIKPQLARGILPINVKTQVGITANFEAWRTIINRRYFGDTGVPHPDIQFLTGQVLLWFRANFPVIVEDLK